jgi:hypothetical protein
MTVLLLLTLPWLLLEPFIRLVGHCVRTVRRVTASRRAAQWQARYGHLNVFDRIVEEELDRFHRRSQRLRWLTLVVIGIVVAIACVPTGPGVERPKATPASVR